MFLMRELAFVIFFSLAISGCSNSSSGSGSTSVSATSSEANSMFNSVGALPKIADYIEYAETRESNPALTAAQEDLLKFCQKNSSSTGDASNFTSEIGVAGPGCPISYSLDTQGSSVGDNYSAVVNINYQVLSENFANTVEIQSANCSINLAGTATENFSLSGDVNCHIVSKTNGVIDLAVTLQVENSLNSKIVTVNAIITSGAKTANVKVSVKTISGAKTTEILVNGEAITDRSDIGNLTDLLAI